MADNTTLTVAVLSGKGGVGKSNLALNISFALSRKGAKVLLMDCDLGLANLDVLLGITPAGNIQDVLDSNLKAEKVLVRLDQGLDLLPASSGLVESFNNQHLMPALLTEKLEKLVGQYDYVIMDVGAGISPTVLNFASMAMMRILVVTPEPTSLTDSYALVKVLATRHGIRDHLVVVNQTESGQQEDMTYRRLAAACSHFLNITPVQLGGVRNDPNLSEAVRVQRPMLLECPNSKATKDFYALGDKIGKLRQSMLPRIAGLAPLQMPDASGRNQNGLS